MDDLRSRKKTIRERILHERAALTDGEHAAKSRAICAAVESIPEYQQAKSILFYMPFRGEVDISPLMLSALARGVRCVLPRCTKDRCLRLLEVADPDTDVETGTWGIREPKDCLCECTRKELSVIIVPGVAFDRRGRRLGYGAGYYDRLLAGGAGAFTIAPAFALQVLEELPHGVHDVPVDVVVTEEEIIGCRRAGEG